MALGVVFILFGLGILVMSAEITNRFAVQVASDSQPPDPTQVQPPVAWYLPTAVFGAGISLVAFGGNLIRTTFTMSVHGFMTRSSPGGVGGMGSPEAFLDRYLASVTSAMEVSRAAPPPPEEKTVVKIKCRNCGSLESDDAAYCRKCGQAL